MEIVGWSRARHCSDVVIRFIVARVVKPKLGESIEKSIKRKSRKMYCRRQKKRKRVLKSKPRDVLEETVEERSTCIQVASRVHK